MAERLISMPKQIAITFWSLVAGCMFAFGVVALMIAHWCRPADLSLRLSLWAFNKLICRNVGAFLLRF